MALPGTFSVNSDVKKIEASFKRKITSLNTYNKRFASRFARKMRDRIVEKRLSGPPGLTSRTGRLAASFKYSTWLTKDRFGMVVYSRSPYAFIHEHGRMIVAKERASLAIPFSWARPGGYHMFQPHVDTNYPNRFKVVKPKGGGAFLFDTVFSKFSHTLRYSVYIPARLKALETIRKYLPTIHGQYKLGINRILNRNGR